jgi:hypothetical protein
VSLKNIPPIKIYKIKKFVEMILKKHISLVFFMLASLMSVKSKTSIMVIQTTLLSGVNWPLVTNVNSQTLQILTKYQTIVIFELFYTTYSWDGNYKKTRAEFAQVIKMTEEIG